MTRLALIALACLVLSACGNRSGGGVLGTSIGAGLRSDAVLFDGLRFRTRLDTTSDDNRDFTVTVRDVSRNVPAALEAGQFEAVKYCIGAFGASDTDWTIGPDQDPEAVQVAADDTTTLAGRCTRR